MSHTSDKLYIGLRHGRNTPDEQLNDWGFDGPVIGPIGIVWTYGNIRVFNAGFEADQDLPQHEGLIAYDGKFFGDFDIYVEGCETLKKRLAGSEVHDWAKFDAIVTAKKKADQAAEAWSSADQARAEADGWFIANVDSTGAREIQRVDEDARFPSDEDAIAHVTREADAGSELHQRALAFVGANAVAALFSGRGA